MNSFCAELGKAARLARTAVLPLGLVLLSACSTSRPVASSPAFSEADAADFINKYYSDEVSYVLKPVTMEGQYQSICDRAKALNLARQQPGRDLAVVLLIHYETPAEEEPVKAAWQNDLASLGFRRIVFLRADRSLRANGSPIVEPPHVPTAVAGK
jgi:hypothetical protein